MLVLPSVAAERPMGVLHGLDVPPAGSAEGPDEMLC